MNKAVIHDFSLSLSCLFVLHGSTISLVINSKFQNKKDVIEKTSNQILFYSVRCCVVIHVVPLSQCVKHCNFILNIKRTCRMWIAFILLLQLLAEQDMKTSCFICGIPSHKFKRISKVLSSISYCKYSVWFCDDHSPLTAQHEFNGLASIKNVQNNKSIKAKQAVVLWQL